MLMRRMAIALLWNAFVLGISCREIGISPWVLFVLENAVSHVESTVGGLGTAGILPNRFVESMRLQGAIAGLPEQ